jgi:hypothetical protein
MVLSLWANKKRIEATQRKRSIYPQPGLRDAERFTPGSSDALSTSFPLLSLKLLEIQRMIA